MKREVYRYFTPDSLPFTREEQDILAKELFNEPFQYSLSIKWSMINFDRSIEVRMNGNQVTLNQNLRHIGTEKRLRKEFGKAMPDNTLPPVHILVNRLAIHDVSRQLKNILVNYYNSKILDLSKY